MSGIVRGVMTGLALACGIGCATRPPPPASPARAATPLVGAVPTPVAPPEAVAGRVQLMVRMQVARDGRAVRPVALGEALQTGDRLELFVEVDRAAYVYLVQFFADGSSAVLFPPADDVRLQPGPATRIPRTGQWFQLDDARGEENIYVLASSRPLAQADLVAHDVIQEVRVSQVGTLEPAPAALPAAAPVAPPPRPRRRRKASELRLSMKTRGLVTVTEGGAQAIRATTDPTGVAVFRLWFLHEGRP